MRIAIESRHLEDVVILVPEVFEDDRGFFMETFRADQFESLGLPSRFVQDNPEESFGIPSVTWMLGTTLQ